MLRCIRDLFPSDPGDGFEIDYKTIETLIQLPLVIFFTQSYQGSEKDESKGLLDIKF